MFAQLLAATSAPALAAAAQASLDVLAANDPARALLVARTGRRLSKDEAETLGAELQAGLAHTAFKETPIIILDGDLTLDLLDPSTTLGDLAPRKDGEP